MEQISNKYWLKNIVTGLKWFDTSKMPLHPLQYQDEFVELLSEYRKFQHPIVVLEIGTYKGGTLWWWLKNAPSGSTVLSIDLPIEDIYFDLREPGIDYSKMWHEWSPPDVNFKFFNKKSATVKTTSLIKEYIKDKPIDFLFIDGDHSLPGLCGDIRTYLPMVKKGGIVAIHDICYGDIAKVWRRIKPQYKTREIITPSPTPGFVLGIGVIYI